MQNESLVPIGYNWDFTALEGHAADRRRQGAEDELGAWQEKAHAYEHALEAKDHALAARDDARIESFSDRIAPENI